jgi:hypothetical protein
MDENRRNYPTILDIVVRQMDDPNQMLKPMSEALPSRP